MLKKSSVLYLFAVFGFFSSSEFWKEPLGKMFVLFQEPSTNNLTDCIQEHGLCNFYSRHSADAGYGTTVHLDWVNSHVKCQSCEAVLFCRGRRGERITYK